MTTLSVIVPALNEEANLLETVSNICTAAEQYFSAFEILIFNDGSQDRTGQIANELAKAKPFIRAFHHPTPKNLGYCYKAGVAQAQYEHVILIPGDNECGLPVMEPIFALAGSADMIIPYPANDEARGKTRRFLSELFSKIMRTMGRTKIRYFNGTVLHRTSLIKNEAAKISNGFSYQAELLLKRIRAGASYHEVPITLSVKQHQPSRAFRLLNILQTTAFFIRLTQMKRLSA